MDETPDRPDAPAQPGGTPPGTPPTRPTTPATGSTPPASPPLPPTASPPTADDLPPLADVEDPPAGRALTPRRLLAAVGLVAVVAVVGFVGLTGGDGDDDGTDGVATIDGGDGDDGSEESRGGGGGGRVDNSELQDAMLEYAQCMRDHGVDMPDPQFDDGGPGVQIGGRFDEGDGPSRDEMEAADEACSPIMDDVRPDIQLTPEEQAELQDEMVAVSECMRDKGWNMPDPEVGENGEVRVRVEPGDETGGRAPTPENQEEHQDDLEACHEELGIERGGAGPAIAGGGDG
ncbi:MAG TPA: hypothetical protein VIL36_09165 [Acidimicrobiales bacterium]